MPTQKGSVKLFRLLGIDVYLHWTWFVAFLILTRLPHSYSNYGWSGLEILSLFCIVLTHEFGHALACRSVGGTANLIVLWPLGGVAYVAPPQRPGAQLWSIAAGPLVNVILFPLLTLSVIITKKLGWDVSDPDAFMLLAHLALINTVLLFFNLLPIYPLDGGQILRSVLWFPFGRASSLFATSIIGFISLAGLIILAVYTIPIWLGHVTFFTPIWLGLISFFILMNCWGGLKQAQVLLRMSKIPRRAGFACPSCRTAPPLGELWRCSQCQQPFDTFLTHATCPHCNAQYPLTQCLDCGTRHNISDWIQPESPTPH